MRPVQITKLVLALLVLVLPLALAQTHKPSSSTAESTAKYDPATEVKLKVTVEEVSEVPNAKGEISVRLTVKQAAETFEVRLCPHSFLKEFEVTFAKGDQLEITGSKVKANDKTVILAREIVRGNSTLVLRDKEGTPVWTWLRK